MEVAEGIVDLAFVVEFIVPGAPATVNWKDKGARHRKNYKRWKNDVAQAAALALPDGFVFLIDESVQATLVYYYRQNTRDLDNILKPILDGMGSDADPNDPHPPVVWKDDNVVNRIYAERVNLEDELAANAPPTIVLETIGRVAEFVYVRIDRIRT